MVLAVQLWRRVATSGARIVSSTPATYGVSGTRSYSQSRVILSQFLILKSISGFSEGFAIAVLLYAVKVGIPEFLRVVGEGLEAHVAKLEAEITDLQKLLVTRILRLKKLGIPCKHVLHSLSLIGH